MIHAELPATATDGKLAHSWLDQWDREYATFPDKLDRMLAHFQAGRAPPGFDAGRGAEETLRLLKLYESVNHYIGRDENLARVACIALLIGQGHGLLADALAAWDELNRSRADRRAKSAGGKASAAERRRQSEEDKQQIRRTFKERQSKGWKRPAIVHSLEQQYEKKYSARFIQLAVKDLK